MAILGDQGCPMKYGGLFGSRFHSCAFRRYLRSSSRISRDIRSAPVALISAWGASSGCIFTVVYMNSNVVSVQWLCKFGNWRVRSAAVSWTPGTSSHVVGSRYG